MKPVKLFLIIIFIYQIFLVNAFAQQISYILPDIGSPGMNIYFEIIGPTGTNDNFGADGFYLNDQTSNVKIECVSPADEEKITFGPLVVSWQGRMISSQAFINPAVEPNSSYWSDLQNAYRIPVRVNVNGTFSTIDTFYIVKPYHLGDISSNPDRVFGEGTLGRRSRRGAMIVDSLILASSQTYTVTKTDCDPITSGNQAYLPFVLLSKGKINGQNINTIISVNGSAPASGAGGNGGPGGGGGGGRFCDWAGSGDAGGNGFTGGGPGGRNSSGNPFSSDYQNIKGTGTYSNGASLNSVTAPAFAWYEASGGGTGHPFGLSGNGCNDGGACNPPGGYGGGSGYQQNQKGGSGGYASVGSNSNAGTNTGGQIVGNLMGVPLAGGSGGASGNPQGMNECSGSGGGGGGAILIFGNTIQGLSLHANGGDGGSGDGNGGSGSGGLIAAFAKQSLYNVASYVTGGVNATTTGGSGRVRADAMQYTSYNYSPTATASSFKGFASDTSHYIDRIHTIQGSKETGRTLAAYIKPENGDWNQVALIQTNSNWTAALDLNFTTDTLFYFVVLQDVNNPITAPYLNEPARILSQSAANVLIIKKMPEIAGDSIATFQIANCEGSFKDTTIYIRNNGDSPLTINFDQSNFLYGNLGFQLISPHNEVIISVDESVPVTLRFTYQTGQSGTITDSLFIPNSSPNKDPWIIKLVATIEDINLEIYDITITNPILRVDFRTRCIGEQYENPLVIRNNSNLTLNLSDPVLNPADGFAYEILGERILPPNDTCLINILFTPAQEITYNSTLTFGVDECATYTKQVDLEGTGHIARFDLSTNQIDLGNICNNDSIFFSFFVKNNDLFFININNVNLNLPNSSYTIEKNQILPNDSSEIIIKLFANGTGNIQGKIYISSDGCGLFTDSLNITANVVETNLEIVNVEPFGPVRIGQKDTITVTLINNGNAAAYIRDYPIVNPPFRIVGIDPTNPPFLLPSGVEMSFDLEFAPTDNLTDSTYITVFSFANSGACDDSVGIPIKATIVEPEIVMSKYNIDFGKIAVCQTKRDTVYLTNNGTGEVNLTNDPEITGQNISNFKLIQFPSPRMRIEPGATVSYIIEFDPNNSPAGVKTAQLIIYTDDLVDSQISISLTGESLELNVQANPNSIDFGSVPIGETANQVLTLTNLGELDARISKIISDNANITFLPNQDIYLNANGGNTSIDLSLIFANSGNNNGTISILFDLQCSDTINIPFIGQALEGNIVVPDIIEYGQLAPCEDETRDLVVENTGTAPIILQSINLVGQDAVLFAIITQPTLPLTLNPGETATFQISFTPASTSDGTKTCNAVVNAIVNAEQVNVITQLVGEKVSAILALPNEVVFGNVIVGNTVSKELVIKNNSNVPINLDSLLLQNGTPQFTYQPDYKDRMIPVDDSIIITIRFTPTEITAYSDTIDVFYKVFTCNDIKKISIRGNGMPANSVIVWLPDTIVNPNIKDFQFPLYAKLENNGSPVKVRFNATLRFNASMLYIYNDLLNNVSILNDTIIYNDTEDISERVLQLSFDETEISFGKKIIHTFPSSTLLGDRKSTTLNWSDITFTNENNEIGDLRFINSILESKICEQGGDRLLKYTTPLHLRVYPVPASEKIIVDVQANESGEHKIELFGLNNQKTVLERWNVVPNTNKSFNFVFKTNEIVNGIYTIILTTPTEIRYKQVIILK